MSTTRFISNDSLWNELQTRVKAAKRVHAAVAFVGSGGAKILPLKKGDSLVVNLGMQTVKQGLTSPKEIQKFIRRGVRVFTRSTLHAKFFLCDQTLIVGSANISQHSQKVLDETATMTTEPTAVRRAKDFFDDLCTEPVRPNYLKECLNSYKPPKFKGDGAVSGQSKQKRIVEAKLWFIGGLRYIAVPEKEAESIEAIEENAEKQLADPEKTVVSWTRYPKKPKFLDHLRVGDWIVDCIRDDDGVRHVNAPAQVLGLESYRREGGKWTYILTHEASQSAESMLLDEFRRCIRKIAPKLDADSPRTRPLQDVETADAILRLWTPSGRLSQRSRTK